MEITLYFIASFLSGSIPTAYWIGKWAGRIDIRRHGSGNVGATNALRVMGKGAGAVVLGIDFVKGYLPVYFFGALYPELRLCFGFSAVLGHVFTPFLGFKGGKGVATGGGALLGFSPFLFLSSLGVWALVFWMCRVVSISSLVSCFVLAPMAVLKGGYAVSEVLLLSSFFIFSIWTHRSNLARLGKGQEPKFNKQKM